MVIILCAFWGLGEMARLEIDILDKLDASLSRLVELDGLD